MTHADKSQFLSLVPMAWALRTAGHEVRVASQPKLTETVIAAGLTAVPLGDDHTLQEGVAFSHNDYKKITLKDPRLHVFGGLDPPVAGWADERALHERLVGSYFSVINNDSFVDALVSFARHWRPDLIIWEPLSYAGGVAARVVGAAHARLLWGPDVVGRSRETYLSLMVQQPVDQRVDPFADWLGGLLARHGSDFAEDVVTGQFTIDPAPASARLPVKLHTVPVRYVPYNGSAVVPGWLHEPPKRPRVCFTTGISLRQVVGHDAFPVAALRIFADLDIELVATLIPRRGTNPVVPDNIRVVDFVPLHALLPTCSAILHFGGGGTWSTAMINAVPQLVFAHVWDTVVTGEHLERSGAGIFLDSPELNIPDLRKGLGRLLDEPSFAESARRLRDEMLAEPTPASLVPTLEKLVADYRT